MLDLGLVLALAQTCAPTVSAPTLAAIAHVESRFNPLAIGVNRGTRLARAPRTQREAAIEARRLIATGANVDLGLAQINNANLAWLDLSIEDAFDPCRNLAAAARVLKAGYRPVDASLASRQNALRVALSRYNTGHPSRGFANGYVAKVEQAAVRLSLADPPEPQAGPVPQPSPLTSQPSAPSWDVFARGGGRVVVFATAPEPRT